MRSYLHTSNNLGRKCVAIGVDEAPTFEKMVRCQRRLLGELTNGGSWSTPGLP